MLSLGGTATRRQLLEALPGVEPDYLDNCLWSLKQDGFIEHPEGRPHGWCLTSKQPYFNGEPPAPASEQSIRGRVLMELADCPAGVEVSLLCNLLGVTTEQLEESIRCDVVMDVVEWSGRDTARPCLRLVPLTLLQLAGLMRRQA